MKVDSYVAIVTKTLLFVPFHLCCENINSTPSTTYTYVCTYVRIYTIVSMVLHESEMFALF